MSSLEVIHMFVYACGILRNMYGHAQKNHITNRNSVVRYSLMIGIRIQ